MQSSGYKCAKWRKLEKGGCRFFGEDGGSEGGGKGCRSEVVGFCHRFCEGESRMGGLLLTTVRIYGSLGLARAVISEMERLSSRRTYILMGKGKIIQG